MQRPEVLEMWMDQGINVLCLLLDSFPHNTQCSARVFLAVVHKTVNSRDLSIMTAGFFSPVICQHGVYVTEIIFHEMY